MIVQIFTHDRENEGRRLFLSFHNWFVILVVIVRQCEDGRGQMHINDYIVEENTSVIDTMKQINSGARGIAFVCQGMKLCAVVTDGDIRRYILKNGDLEQPVCEIAHGNPVYLSAEQAGQAGEVMRKCSITAVPIVNENKEIIDIKFWRDEFRDSVQSSHSKQRRSLHIPLVIMAGGKGTRLRPYTDILPKPLIPVGDKTITEHIMDRFAAYGCGQVMMIVNYKKDFIKAYYADSEIHRDITFIEEDEYLGTGGGLCLLADKVEDTFFMSNCDILIDADYAEILDYHKRSGNMITMVCVQKNFEIPYGTVTLDRNRQIVQMEEKPKFGYYVNTGFYVVEPSFVARIPQNTFIHITDVIGQCIASGDRVGGYLIQDDAWMDMGQFDELEKMKQRLNNL